MRRLRGHETGNRAEDNQAGRDLQVSEALFRALTELSDDLTMIVSGDLVIVYASPSIRYFAGETVPGAFEPFIRRMLHPEDYGVFRNRFDDSLAQPGKAIETPVVRVRSRAQTLVYVNCKITNLLDAADVAGIVINVRDVTARVRAEEELRRNEERFRAITEKTEDINLVVDALGHTSYVSPSVKKVLGYEPEEVVDKLRQIVLDEDSALIIDKSMELLRERPGESLYMDKLRGRHKDGHWLYFEGSLTNLLYEPAVRGFIFNGRDITERILAEEALLESEARYRNLFDQSQEAIVITNLDGIIEDANAYAADLLGYEVGEIIGMHASSLSVPEERTDTRARLGSLLTGLREPPVYERHVLRKDGSALPVEVSLMLITDDEGQPKYIRSIARDISEKKAAEWALAEAQQKYQRIIERASDVVFVTSVNGVFEYVNPAIEALLGFPPEALIGQHSTEVVLPEWKETVIAFCTRQIRARQERAKFEFPVLTSEGDVLWVEQTTTLLRERGEIVGMEGIVRNITERKQAEERLRHMALHDPLTGLPNRSYFFRRLPETLRKAEESGMKAAVFYLDLDDFKPVNDTYGHEMGDEVLKAVSGRLRRRIRDVDYIARLGGDEFAIVQTEIMRREDAARLAERLAGSVARPFYFGGTVITVTCSIGISIYPDDGQTTDELVNKADRAMYAAKGKGKNETAFFGPDSPVSV